MKNIVIDGQIIDLSSPSVMAVINATPDSFYNESCAETPEILIRNIEFALQNGASFIDLGACSTRPGSTPVSASEELNRVSNALRLIRNHFGDIPISIDTFRSSVAETAVKDFNCAIINDISAFSSDDKMLDTIVSFQRPYILGHYPEEAVSEDTPDDIFIASVLKFFSEKIEILRNRGFNSDIIIDPNFGFKKTLHQNYVMLRNLGVLKCFGLPILAGLSRKSMIYKVLGTTPENALNGTTILNTVAVMNGADILRVHDPLEASQICKLLSL